MTTRTLFRTIASTCRRRPRVDPAASHERYASTPERLMLAVLR